ncbi:melatonin receptor type 1B [Striga asiatica]|uniref:Melatonin receptor type 1B n=1 Tax=Striga asiatica TaxID=4170 RepID=A0A5A7P662_STRAF|nr:melatonin receptor type 1B [Striga asiatica]
MVVRPGLDSSAVAAQQFDLCSAAIDEARALLLHDSDFVRETNSPLTVNNRVCRPKPPSSAPSTDDSTTGDKEFLNRQQGVTDATSGDDFCGEDDLGMIWICAI